MTQELPNWIFLSLYGASLLMGGFAGFMIGSVTRQILKRPDKDDVVTFAIKETTRQRDAMISSINATSELEMFMRVSWEQHYRELVHKRSALLLYPKVHRKKFFNAINPVSKDLKEWLEIYSPETMKAYHETRKARIKLLDS